jgi:hypothetical protein
MRMLKPRERISIKVRLAGEARHYACDLGEMCLHQAMSRIGCRDGKAVEVEVEVERGKNDDFWMRLARRGKKGQCATMYRVMCTDGISACIVMIFGHQTLVHSGRRFARTSRGHQCRSLRMVPQFHTSTCTLCTTGKKLQVIQIYSTLDIHDLCIGEGMLRDILVTRVNNKEPFYQLALALKARAYVRCAACGLQESDQSLGLTHSLLHRYLSVS